MRKHRRLTLSVSFKHFIGCVKHLSLWGLWRRREGGGQVNWQISSSNQQQFTVPPVYCTSFSTHELHELIYVELGPVKHHTHVKTRLNHEPLAQLWFKCFKTISNSHFTLIDISYFFCFWCFYSCDESLGQYFCVQLFCSYKKSLTLLLPLVLWIFEQGFNIQAWVASKWSYWWKYSCHYFCFCVVLFFCFFYHGKYS